MNRARRHPVRRVSLAALVLALVLVGPTVAFAASDSTATTPYAQLSPGDRIRVIPNGDSKARTIGSFIALHADTLVMQGEWDDTTTSRVLDANTTVELSEGKHGNFPHDFLMGALIGGGIAALIGAAGNAFDTKQAIGESITSGSPTSMEMGAIGILAGIVVMGAVGTFIGGSVMRHEDWRMLTPPPNQPTSLRLDAHEAHCALVTVRF